MAQWEIAGADRQTGQDVAYTTEQEDERAAMLEAKKRGIVVSTCRPVVVPPNYSDVATYKLWLRVVGAAIAIAGGAALLGALGCFLAFANSTTEAKSAAMMSASITLALAGVSALCFAPVLFMLATIGGAVTDIARNTFRR